MYVSINLNVITGSDVTTPYNLDILTGSDVITSTALIL